MDFASRLVKVPTAAGEHDCTPALLLVHERLQIAEIHSDLISIDGQLVALLARTGRPRLSGHTHRTLCLSACLDTAPANESDWSFEPLVGDVEDGWLRGRGAADSKLMAAMFTQLICEQDTQVPELSMILVADEHTASARGLASAVAKLPPMDIAIGGNSMDSVQVGARGYVRCRIHVAGTQASSGDPKRERDNAAVSAAWLTLLLEKCRRDIPLDEAFGFAGEITVTGISAGSSFDAVPDAATIELDIRTTPTWSQEAAMKMVEAAIEKQSAECKVEIVHSSKAYRLAQHGPLIKRLESATDHLKTSPKLEVTAGSNIGNWLTGQGFEVLHGLGVSGEGVHGIDERARLDDLEPILLAYRKLIASYA